MVQEELHRMRSVGALGTAQVRQRLGSHAEEFRFYSKGKSGISNSRLTDADLHLFLWQLNDPPQGRVGKLNTTYPVSAQQQAGSTLRVSSGDGAPEGLCGRI